MKANVFASFAVLTGFLLTSPITAVGQEANTGSKLQVHVNYSGTGTVDDKHKIYVVLWDSPEFVRDHPAGQGPMPFLTHPASSKDEVVSFDDVKKTPVYVSAAYDPAGKWDAQSPPPEGSSLGLHSKTADKPDPVNLKPGETTDIKLPFDDTVKMKNGRAAK